MIRVHVCSHTKEPMHMIEHNTFTVHCAMLVSTCNCVHNHTLVLLLDNNNMVQHLFQFCRICCTTTKRLQSTNHSAHHRACRFVRLHLLHSKLIITIHFTHEWYVVQTRQLLSVIRIYTISVVLDMTL